MVALVVMTVVILVVVTVVVLAIFGDGWHVEKVIIK